MRRIMVFITIVSALAVLNNIFALRLGYVVTEYIGALGWFLVVALAVATGVLILIHMED